MKHKALYLAVFAAAGALFLTACTSSEEEIAQGVRTESSGNAGTADVGAGDSGAQQDNTGQDPAAGGDIQTQPETERQIESPAATEGETSSSEAQTDASPTEDTGGTADVEDIWSGTYISDQETVTISLTDAQSFAFSFANSGIASTAAVDGSQAVYNGDDHHVVVFEINEDILNVTVTSEEDFDASASPLNGTYVRE